MSDTAKDSNGYKPDAGNSWGSPDGYDTDAVLWADAVLAEPWGAYSVQFFMTTRAPWRSVIRAAGQRATAAR